MDGPMTIGRRAFLKGAAAAPAIAALPAGVRWVGDLAPVTDLEVAHGHALTFDNLRKGHNQKFLRGIRDILVEDARRALPEGTPFDIRWETFDYDRKYGMAWYYRPSFRSDPDWGRTADGFALRDDRHDWVGQYVT